MMANFRVVSNFGGVTSNYTFINDKFKINFGVSTSWYDRNHMMSYKPNILDYTYVNKGLKNEVSSFVKVHYNTRKKTILFGDVQYRDVSFKYQSNILDTARNLNMLNWRFINPKGGVKYIQDDNLSFYTSVGQTHREPTRNDLFNGYDDITPINGYTYIGGGVDTVDIHNIKPESVIDYELGADYRCKKVSIHLNGYFMDFSNEIASIGKLSYIGLPLRKNVSKSLRSGIEFDMTWVPVSGLSITQNVNYCYAKIKEYTTDYDMLTYKNVSPLLTPKVISNTTVCYNTKWLSVGVTARYLSKTFLDNTQNDLFVTPQYFIMDGYIHTDFIHILTSVEIGLVIFHVIIHKLLPSILL